MSSKSLGSCSYGCWPVGRCHTGFDRLSINPVAGITSITSEHPPSQKDLHC